jgi:hypothetical protein
MSKVLQYSFYLILILIVVAYFKGTTNVLGTLFSGANTVINTLQGRDSKGKFSDYPQGA